MQNMKAVIIKLQCDYQVLAEKMELLLLKDDFIKQQADFIQMLEAQVIRLTTNGSMPNKRKKPEEKSKPQRQNPP